MSLADWLSKNWLTEHEPSAQEIAELLEAADRDLADCEVQGLSADWRLSIAHNAALLSATAALAAWGYRASGEAHHYRVIQSLAHTIGAEQALVEELDAVRKKRNVGGYERAGIISEGEATNAVESAREVRKMVEEWITENHPELSLS